MYNTVDWLIKSAFNSRSRSRCCGLPFLPWRSTQAPSSWTSLLSLQLLPSSRAPAGRHPPGCWPAEGSLQSQLSCPQSWWLGQCFQHVQSDQSWEREVLMMTRIVNQLELTCGRTRQPPWASRSWWRAWCRWCRALWQRPRWRPGWDVCLDKREFRDKVI